jgi:Family of unknown function (DUF6498)
MQPVNPSQPNPTPRRKTASRFALVALVAANLIVAAAAFHGRWGWADVLRVYWIETTIIGIVNVLKMLVWALFRKPLNTLTDLREAGTRLALVMLLVPYYSAAFFFLVLVLGFAIHGDGKEIPRLVLIFALSHGVSFVWNYLGHAEFRSVSFLALLAQPYARLALMAAVFALGFLITRVVPGAGRSTAFAVSVVICKLAADLVSHVWEHARATMTPAAPSRPPTQVPPPPVVPTPAGA